MAGDPFGVLGVRRDASSTEIKSAYERRLAEASRLGASKLAQEIVATYDILGDPRRRALFERHGIAAPLPRLHPDQRLVPPRAVPWRAWSPTETKSHSTPTCARTRQPVRSFVFGAIVATVASIGIGDFLYDHSALFSGQSKTTYVVPTSPTGQMLVICERRQFGSGYSFVARSGASVSCSSGKAPEFTTP